MRRRRSGSILALLLLLPMLGVGSALQARAGSAACGMSCCRRDAPAPSCAARTARCVPCQAPAAIPALPPLLMPAATALTAPIGSEEQIAIAGVSPRPAVARPPDQPPRL
jgi:hypothetical protein